MKSISKKFKEKGIYGTCNAIRTRCTETPRKIFINIKLKKLINDYQARLKKGLEIKEIREKTLNYIESMRVKDEPYGKYRYSESQKYPVLYASLYAALTRHLYRDLDTLTEKQRKEWIDYIQSFQDDDGLFKDTAVENEIAASCDWWGWRHLTLHALMALTVLGATAMKRFKIIDPFKETDFTIRWLENRDWVIDPANTSNEVQNYFTLLHYARDFQGEGWADKILEKAYGWLNEKQDSKTGLWGVRFDTPTNLSNGVQTGYHIWLLYFYDKRLIRNVERIIDSCLSTKNEIGGFGVPLNSSACEDIDSIDPLIRLSSITNYRKSDIHSAIQKAIPWIITNMNEDGGFVFRRMEPFVYGHQLMSSCKDESAMFPTWFRTLSLAYVGKYLPDSLPGKFDWQFIKCPGHQFWNM